MADTQDKKKKTSLKFPPVIAKALALKSALGGKNKEQTVWDAIEAYAGPEVMALARKAIEAERAAAQKFHRKTVNLPLPPAKESHG